MAFEHNAIFDPATMGTDTLDDVCDRGSVTDQVISPGGLDLADNNKIRLGTGNDATIYYDNTNLVIDPKEVGAGIVKVNGKGSFEDLDVDTLNFNSNVITDSTGTISFSTSNLLGSGALDFDGLTVGTTAGGSITDIKDEDNMVSDSQTALATQQSIKAYADALTLDNVCDIGSSTDQVISPGGLDLDDNEKIRLGTANDATIYYDDTNLVINPKEVGTGFIDTNSANLKCGRIGIGADPLSTTILRIALAASGTATYAMNFSPTLTATTQHNYGLYLAPIVTQNANGMNYYGIRSSCASFTGQAISGYYAFLAAEPIATPGPPRENYGLRITNFTKGTVGNFAIYTDLGDVSFGDDLVLRNDNDKFYLGGGKDAYLEFDGDSLNIVANAVTGTDDLNLTADVLNLDANLIFSDAKDISFNTTTGTKIGTATAQKLSFYNATPVDQPVTVTDAATQDLTGAGTVDQTKLEADLTSCKDAVNAVIDRLQELGLIA